MHNGESPKFLCFFTTYHLLIEVVLKVGESAQLLLAGFSVYLLDPGPDFVLDGFFDELPIVETALFHGPVLAVEDDGGNVFYEDGEVILAQIIVLQEVVQLVGVQLVPNEVGYRNNHKDKTENGQSVHGITVFFGVFVVP